MIIIERFERGATPRSHPSPPTPVIRIDKRLCRLGHDVPWVKA
jgi:hypothetical protein